MTNNQLTDLRIEQLLEKVGVFTLDKSQDLQSVAAALREIQERRKSATRAIELLNAVNRDNVFETVGRLKVIISGDYS